MKKTFYLNYFCLFFVFVSIISLAGCGSTPEGTLQEFKKAVDSKNGNKIWSFLSSKDHKFYNDGIEGAGLDRKTVRNGKQFFMIFVEEIHDSPNTGKPLEIESVTEKSKNKVVIFVKNNPTGFTLVKEYGTWKVSMLGEDGWVTSHIYDYFITPEDILQEFKKAVDSKNGHKMLRLLSSNDEEYYEKMIDKKKLISPEDVDNVKNGKLSLKEFQKKREDAISAIFFVKIMKDFSDLLIEGKELKIKSFTKKSEDKLLVFIEDQQKPFTFVKENGAWKISLNKKVKN